MDFSAFFPFQRHLFSLVFLASWLACEFNLEVVHYMTHVRDLDMCEELKHDRWNRENSEIFKTSEMGAQPRIVCLVHVHH